MEYGYAVKHSQQTVSTEPEEKFSPSPPTFKQPTIHSAADYLSIAEKDHSPSAPVIQLVRNKGNERLAQLLEQAKANAKQHAKILDRRGVKNSIASKPPTHRHANKRVEYGEEHILTDAEFIRLTRDMKITDQNLKPLVLANGGQIHMDLGYTLATAFEMLRREKQARLHYREVEVVNPLKDAKVFVPGVPSKHDRLTKMKQAQVKHEEEETK